MIRLLDKCKLVVTDSGGLQKESYFHNKMCVCLREETEWKELEEDGLVIVAGTNPDDILESVKEALIASPEFGKNFYGTGMASKFIVNEILKSI